MTELESRDALVARLVLDAAVEFRGKYHRPYIGLDDLQQECWLWMLSHPAKVDEYLSEEHGSRRLSRALRNAAHDFCVRQVAEAEGYRASDLHYYEVGEIEALLPYVFALDDKVTPPASEDENGGRSRRPANEGNAWIVLLADTSKAFFLLDYFDQEVLRRLVVLDESQYVLAEVLGVSQQTVSSWKMRALRRMQKTLGGARPRVVHDETCGHVGARRVVSNSEAIARTGSEWDG